MGYSIFYSYQSDTKKKLNQIFIRDAINAAIAKITDFSLDPLMEGFYGVGGNPPLAETMLEKSEDSDIFIGDVTFTSSKIWQSQGVKFHQDSNSYLIEIDKSINLKPAPNPNVLIETGYSWALKTFKRSILVMNEAFGDPSLLPVDMSGLRWPITYNLSEERFNKQAKYDKEFSNLTLALEQAIRNAIMSAIVHQRKLLSPMLTMHDWKKIHEIKYHVTPDIQTIILNLRDLILNGKESIRVLGKRGVGKTRLLKEVLFEHGDIPLVDKNETIVYHDLDGPLEDNISKQLHFLFNKNQEIILILDNCPYQKHLKYDELFKTTNLKLITIDTIHPDAENIKGDINISDKVAMDLIERLLKEKFPDSEINDILQRSQGNITKVIPYLQEKTRLIDYNKSPEEVIAINLGDDKVKKGNLDFLTTTSIFGNIGISNNKKSEIELVVKLLLPEFAMTNLKSVISTLESEDLLKKQGDFLVVRNLNEDLVFTWWKTIDKNKINIIKQISNSPLYTRLINQFKKVINKHNKDKLEVVLFGDKGLFNDEDFLMSGRGEMLLDALISSFPESIIEVTQRIINKAVE